MAKEDKSLQTAAKDAVSESAEQTKAVSKGLTDKQAKDLLRRRINAVTAAGGSARATRGIARLSNDIKKRSKL